MTDGAAPNEKAGIITAGLVHVFTATGAVCALFATLAALDRAWTAAFVWLGVALVIDGIDGTFARMVGVVDRKSVV